MALLNRQYAYTKMENEDPEEFRHRRAQFLIYKVMQKADTRRRPYWFRVKMFKLKIKIGKRLKKLKKGFNTNMLSVKSDFCKQFAYVLKYFKYFIHAKQVPRLQTII